MLKPNRWFVTFLELILITALLCGCGYPVVISMPTDTTPATTKTVDQTTAPAAKEFTYPMEPVTLTINMEPIDYTSIPEWCTNYFWDELQRRTGVTLEFVGGASNAYEASEEFILMLASMDLPDIMQANWYRFNANTAINDGYIIDLNDYAEYMPNFIAAMEAEPKIRMDVTTDEGVLYCFPKYNDDAAVNYMGLAIRQDWLDQLGMGTPETVDEWYNMLTAFKNVIGCPSPLTFEYRWLYLEYAASCLSSPWGVCYDFYVDDNVVKFGPAEEGYKEFLTTMNKWYAEKLIDQDMPSINKATVQAKLASGDAGAVLLANSNINNAISANADNSNYKITGAKSIVKNKGDVPMFGHFSNYYNGSQACAISATSKKKEAAIRFLDYLWSKEGQLFCTYGTEEVTYTKENGQIKLTDFVLNNPDGVPARTILSYYSNVSNVPFRLIDHDRGYTESFLKIKAPWTQNNMSKHIFPSVSYTAAESSLLTNKLTNIDTYCCEMIMWFIIGTEPLENYGAFLDVLNSYGLQSVLTIQQSAYDRYIAR